MYQVIIVGAGPAGAYLAYLLSDQGIDVLLLEKEHIPRYKSCGGAISPKVTKLLDFDLKPVIEDTIYTMVVTHGLTQPITVTTKEPIMYMVRRKQFDNFLVDKAKEAGAKVLEGIRVSKVQETDNGVSVHADGMEWRGQILVGADGAFSIVARTFGLAQKKRMSITLEKEIPVSPEKLSQNRGVIKVDYGLVPTGYAWMFPKISHLSLGVGSLSVKTKELRSLLGKVIEAESLEGEPSTTKVRGWTIPISSNFKDLHNDRALVIGDAAGVANSFTGEGIYTSLFSSLLAAEIIIGQISRSEPSLQRYTSLMQEKMGPELTAASHITRWFYPASGLIHRILQHRQEIALDMIRVVAGEMNYAQFSETVRQQLRTTWTQAIRR